MAERWTTMSVHEDVYERLKAMKRGDESFNGVLKRLSDHGDVVEE